MKDVENVDSFRKKYLDTITNIKGIYHANFTI